MPTYLVQVAYNSEGWSAVVHEPQNRLEKVRPAVEQLGGKLVDGWFAFGEYDVVVICDFPDNVSAAGFSMAVSAGGAVKTIKTTPLMTADEGVKAMEKASASVYEPVTA